MKKTVVYVIILALLGIAYLIIKPPYFIMNKFKPTRSIEDIVNTHAKTAGERIAPYFEKAEVSLQEFELSFLAFKKEQVLELYARNVFSKQWQKIKTYPFTAFSGQLGPKLKEGDKQIPEGIYHIEYLNPNSSYHLSLKVSYPNSFDKKKAVLEERTDLGGDIMIHGKDVTIGCIPVGDEAIEEIFLLAEKAIDRGIPIIIAPQDFRKDETYPNISFIDWEEELYDLIKENLKNY